MGCLPVCGDNPRALASGLSYVQVDKYGITINGPRREKTCLRGVANNKVADQPAHLCSLISAFVILICFWKVSYVLLQVEFNFLAGLCN